MALLCALRSKGSYSEEEIAQKLGFGSVEAMRQRFERWKVPEWLAYRQPPKVGEGVWLPEQKLRQSEPEGALPPADAASPLFREVIDNLARGVEELKYRHQTLRGGQFEVTKEEIELGFESPSGVSWRPAEPLPTLIAMYLLSGRSLEPLLEALHPQPEKANREKMRKLVEDIKRREKGKTPASLGRIGEDCPRCWLRSRSRPRRCVPGRDRTRRRPVRRTLRARGCGSRGPLRRRRLLGGAGRSGERRPRGPCRAGSAARPTRGAYDRGG